MESISGCSLKHLNLWHRWLSEVLQSQACSWAHLGMLTRAHRRGLSMQLDFSQPHSWLPGNPVTAMRTNTSLPAGRSKSCGREPSRFREAILDQPSSQPPAEGRCLNKPSHGQNIWAKVTIIDQLNQTQEKFILKGGCLNWLSLRVFGYFLIQQKLHNPY